MLTLGRRVARQEREARALGLSKRLPVGKLAFLRRRGDAPLERAEARLTEAEMVCFCREVAGVELPAVDREGHRHDARAGFPSKGHRVDDGLPVRGSAETEVCSGGGLGG